MRKSKGLFEITSTFMNNAFHMLAKTLKNVILEVYQVLHHEKS